MSKDGKKPLGDSSVFQKGRKGAMRVIYGRTAIIAVSFLAQIILIGGVANFFRSPTVIRRNIAASNAPKILPTLHSSLVIRFSRLQ